MTKQAAGAGAQASTESAGQQQQRTESTTDTGNTQKTGDGGGTGTGDGQQQQQQQTQQQAGSTAQGKAGEQQAQSKAPAKYDLTLPAGGRVQAAHTARLEEIARANDWSNEEAQAAVEDLDSQLKAQADAFLTTTKADKDYGGDHLPESQRFAKLAIDRIRPDGHPRRQAFMDLLNASGYGNHIEVVAFFADLGRQMGEDRGAAGRSGATGSKDPADAMYDHPTSRKLAAGG